MKAYFISDGELGFAYILNDRKEALKMRSKVQGDLDCEYIDIRVKEIKGADITGLKHGAVEDQIEPKEALKRGIYGYVEELEGACDWCGKETYISEPEDKLFLCGDCEDKWSNGESSPANPPVPTEAKPSSGDTDVSPAKERPAKCSLIEHGCTEQGCHCQCHQEDAV